MNRIAELIEKLDNIIITLQIPMSAEIHIDALKTKLPQIRDELKASYISLGGEDHWKRPEVQKDRCNECIHFKQGPVDHWCKMCSYNMEPNCFAFKSKAAITLNKFIEVV